MKQQNITRTSNFYITTIDNFDINLSMRVRIILFGTLNPTCTFIYNVTVT